MESPTPCIKSFDPKNKHHVKWLQKLDSLINEMVSSNGRTVGLSARMGTVLRSNPFGEDIPPEAFIDVHAGMCIRYAANVLNGDAWLPSTESR